MTVTVSNNSDTFDNLTRLEKENAALRAELDFYKRDFDVMIDFLECKRRDSIHTPHYPSREGIMKTVAEALKSWRGCRKKYLMVRVIGVVAGGVALALLSAAAGYIGVGSNFLISGTSVVIAALLGWRAYVYANRKLCRSRPFDDELLIFAGLLRAALVILGMSATGALLSRGLPVSQQLALVAALGTLTLLALLWIMHHYQRRSALLRTSSLFRAICDENVGAVRQALGDGARIDLPNRNGDTPLKLAMNHPYNKEILRMLIEAGANVGTRDCLGDTVLHYSTFLGDLESVRMVLDRLADVNAVGRNGQTPLHHAVHGRHCKPEIVRLLIERGADVNARASWGHTPLHYAYADTQTEIAAMLVEAGAIETGATWLIKHEYSCDHYDISGLVYDLKRCCPDQRRYRVTPSEIYGEVSEDKLNPRNSAA